jgi:hypothetical protein
MKTTEITNIRIEAEGGKYLFNGETFCKVAYLGVNDSASNWREVTEEEKEEIEAQNDTETE